MMRVYADDKTVSSIQLPISSPRLPAHNLYEYVRSFNHAWYYGSEPERVGHYTPKLSLTRLTVSQLLRGILEEREDRRTLEPVCQYMLCPDGCE